jgi:hypothetical protein
MRKEVKEAIWGLSAFLVLQITLVIFYENYGARYIGDFPLFPASFNNPQKMSIFTYLQIALTVFLIGSFSICHRFNNFMLKAFRIILVVLFVVGLVTINGVALIMLYSIGFVNKILNVQYT